jgi:hypothetical protein
MSARIISDDYGHLSSTIIRRIQAKGSGWAFTPADFSDLGDPRSVGMVLSRLSKSGKVRRVRRGIYEIPHEHPIVGTVGATTEAIATAIARRDGLILSSSGAEAANDLGLSTQVSAKKLYGVGPRSKTINIGGSNSITFKERSSKALAITGRASGTLAEALRNIGRGKVGQADLEALSRRMKASDRRQLIEDIRLVPAWMRPLFRKVAQND